MRLYWSSTSPFVRKVTVSAHELGLSDKLETLPTRVAPNKPDRALLAYNPPCQQLRWLSPLNTLTFGFRRLVGEKSTRLSPAGTNRYSHDHPWPLPDFSIARSLSKKQSMDACDPNSAM